MQMLQLVLKGNGIPWSNSGAEIMSEKHFHPLMLVSELWENPEFFTLGASVSF